jgi:hypothetical protein
MSPNGNAKIPLGGANFYLLTLTSFFLKIPIHFPETFSSFARPKFYQDVYRTTNNAGYSPPLDFSLHLMFALLWRC